MASLRALLPAPGREGQRGDDGDDDRPLPVSQSRQLPKRIRSVPQACQVCRQLKAKCDGGRPRCGTCIDRGRACGYEGEAGQSRQAAMRARLAALEAFIASLRSEPPAQTTAWLQRIRQGEDPLSVVRDEGAGTFSWPPTGAGTALQGSTGSSTGSASGIGTGPEQTASFHLSLPSTHISPRHSLSHVFSMPGHGPGDIVAELVLCNLPTTQMALAMFRSLSGTLFQVFSVEQTDRFCDMAFASAALSATQDERGVAVSCLAAIVAVGMQLAPRRFEPAAMHSAYSVAKHNFELALDVAPLEAVRMAVLLAVFNVMTRNTTALIWIGIGLRLSREIGLSHKTPPDPGMSPAEWTSHRRVWRTLVFLSNWMSFALGSISGQEVEFENVNPASMELEPALDIMERIEAETARMSILVAKILHVHLAFKEITALSFESVTNDLQTWNEQLPPPLQLSELGLSVSRLSGSRSQSRSGSQSQSQSRSGSQSQSQSRSQSQSQSQSRSGSQSPPLLPAEARLSAYRMHMLYLGATMLVYRRMASQYYVDSPSQGPSSSHILLQGTGFLPLQAFDKGVEAVRISGRMLSLIQEETTGEQSHCWIVIVHAYATCILLLHFVTQRQLHRCHPASWAGDMKLAQVCLQILNPNAATGMAERTLTEYYGRLFPLFLELEAVTRVCLLASEHGSTSVGVGVGSDVGIGVGSGVGAGFGSADVIDTPALLLTMPPDTPPERTRMARELLIMLGQPFHKPGSGNVSGSVSASRSNSVIALSKDGESPLAIPIFGLSQFPGLK